MDTWGEIGGGGGGRLNAVEKYLCRSSYISKVASCKFTKNELLHTYFSRILARF